MHRCRELVHPIAREQVDSIVDVWVDAALELEERDLKVMKPLIAAQQRRTALL